MNEYSVHSNGEAENPIPPVEVLPGIPFSLWTEDELKDAFQKLDIKGILRYSSNILAREISLNGQAYNCCLDYELPGQFFEELILNPFNVDLQILWEMGNKPQLKGLPIGDVNAQYRGGSNEIGELVKLSWSIDEKEIEYATLILPGDPQVLAGMSITMESSS